MTSVAELSPSLKNDGYRHTPFPTGPYVVGCTDIMTPPKSDSKLGAFIRLFYPADGESIVSSTSQWPLWLPDPMYEDGYSDFMNMRPSIFKPMFRFMSGKVYIPAIFNGKVHRKLTKCPVVVFSHGLGGCRTAYSTICTELASQGFVVAAVEHRDQSACISYSLTNADDLSEKDPTLFKTNEDGASKSDQDGDNIRQTEANKKSVDVRDTLDSTKIFPRSLKQTWIKYKRIGKDMNEYEIRNQQVHQRTEECMMAYKLLESLNKGGFVDNLVHQDQSLQTTFSNLMDMSNCAIVGHSFGGATVLKTLAQNQQPFKVGVALDAYMFPVEKEMDAIKSINVPLLFINTEKFRPPRNAQNMKLMEQSESERVFMTMRGTIHQSQVDSPFITGAIGRIVFGGSTLDRFIAMSLNNALMLNFLWRHLGFEIKEAYEKYVEKQKSHLIEGIVL